MQNQNTQPKFTLSELRKPSSVLRAAAEVIAHDMETVSQRSDDRKGCCAAFDALENIVYNAHQGRVNRAYSQGGAYYRATDVRDRALARVKEAQWMFEDLYRPENADTWSFWMGKQRTNQQQQRRITALLAAAEVAEAQGK